MLLEYMPGGEIFRKIRDDEKFDITTSKFYLCQIILAI